MTDLAHDAAVVGLFVDTRALYLDGDTNYRLWLSELVDRVWLTKKKMQP